MPRESWRYIKESNKAYKVSSRGRVMSISRGIERSDGIMTNLMNKILKPSIRTDGYPVVTLTVVKNSKKQFTVHRLVAQAFMPTGDKSLDVNHINGKKIDNRLSNLEWCTRSYNIRHAIDNGLNKLRGSDNAVSKLTEPEVVKIKSMIKNKGRTSVIAKKFKISESTISDIKYGRSWRHIK